MNKNEWKIIAENGDYALVDMGNQYVVACRLNKEDMSWAHGTYFAHWNAGGSEKFKCLLEAMQFMHQRTYKGNKPCPTRMDEIAEKCVSHLSDLEEEEFLADELELSESEREYFEVSFSDESEEEEEYESMDLDDLFDELMHDM